MKTLSSTLKNILQILNDGLYHSGAAMGKQLKVSRNAIWKQLQQLQDYGVEIESVQSTGYRLVTPIILLNKRRIHQGLLQPSPFKINRLDLLGSIPSTNDYIKSLPPTAGLNICLAEHQSAGRGRFGRLWVSPLGANIYLSLRWIIEQDPGQFSGLSLILSLAVVKALTQYGIPNLQLKWPNDILWQGKKLGGVLVEMQAETFGSTQIIMGIGLNINMSTTQDYDIHQPWVALNQIVPSYHDRNQIVPLLLNQLIADLTLFQQEGFAYFQPQWEQYDSLAGKQIRLKIGNKSVAGKAQGINNDGYLLLEDEEHVVAAYSSGEASILK